MGCGELLFPSGFSMPVEMQDMWIPSDVLDDVIVLLL